MIVLLDSGPLGLLTHPKTRKPDVQACDAWAFALTASGHQIVIPEVVDYELRRELLRMESADSLIRLEQLAEIFLYQQTTTMIWRTAASLWAGARRRGIQTAPNAALDIDVVLVAHAITLGENASEDVVIATTNVRHLRRFANAELWTEIG